MFETLDIGKEKVDRRNIWRENCWELSKIDEKYQTTDLRIPTNPKQDKRNSYLHVLQ